MIRAELGAIAVLLAAASGCTGGGGDDGDAVLEPTADAGSEDPDETEELPEEPAPPPGDSELVKGRLGPLTIPAGGIATVEVPVDDDALSLLLVTAGSGDSVVRVEYVIDPRNDTLYDRAVGSAAMRTFPDYEGMSTLLPGAREIGVIGGSYLFGLSSDFAGDLVLDATSIVKTGVERDRVVLDVVHHFVSLEEGPDAEAAPEDPDFAVVLATFAETMARAGIVVGTVSFEDVNDPELSSIDSMIATDSELTRLFSLTPAGRALHVYWVEQLSDPDQAYPLDGISGGIPGAATLGGSRQSGVAVATLDLRATPTRLGLVAVHEALHYLGLFHTTESCVGGPDCAGPWNDPIADTTPCTGDDDADDNGMLSPTECLDADAANIMFWSISADTPEITEDQAWVARRSTLPR